MFTGIICHCGVVRDISKHESGLTLAIQTQFQDLVLGESIAVDGACLTVTDMRDDLFYCDLSSETLSLTTAAEYQVGRSVNLERALRVGDRFGGHVVTGHVDGMAKVAAIKSQGDYLEVLLQDFSEADLRYLVPKGSVTINGVSLTINKINLASKTLSLMLIPHTLQITNLKALKADDRVNIEFDQNAKTIAHQLACYLATKEVADVS